MSGGKEVTTVCCTWALTAPDANWITRLVLQLSFLFVAKSKKVENTTVVGFEREMKSESQFGFLERLHGGQRDTLQICMQWLTSLWFIFCTYLH